MNRLPLIYTIASVASFAAALVTFPRNAALSIIWLALGVINFSLFITWKKKLSEQDPDEIEKKYGYGLPDVTRGEDEPEAQVDEPEASEDETDTSEDEPEAPEDETNTSEEHVSEKDQ